MSKLILANFKSNKSIKETEIWLDKLLADVDVDLLDKLEVSVAPSFVALSMVEEKVGESGKKLSVSVQDFSSYSAGSYTGAISGQNLNGLKIKYSIVGHSERRRYFKETSNDVALKVDQCLENGITPIICVDVDYLDEQLRLISEDKLSQCVIAFEPLHAIGTGSNADVGLVGEVYDKVKKNSGGARFIYGGSVDEQNINEYLMTTDGVFVGSAALKVDQFIKVLRAVS